MKVFRYKNFFSVDFDSWWIEFEHHSKNEWSFSFNELRKVENIKAKKVLGSTDPVTTFEILKEPLCNFKLFPKFEIQKYEISCKWLDLLVCFNTKSSSLRDIV